jgi:hypothetical protein
VIAALRGRPMPPAPTRPSTVDSRMYLRGNTVYRDLRATRAGRAHRLDLPLVDLFYCLV